MTTDLLRWTAQRLADGTHSTEPDGVLLARVVSDESAFAELVRRHGRLVWAVCRSRCRTEADAEDAFQATFLTLLRKANDIKRAEQLSSWLYGAAYRVCGQARRAADRRRAREGRAATADVGSAGVVPDSAWDRALEAVHEIAGALPDTLRTPFVLCCLEGLGEGEAAERLGWKRGTLSGRLCRAKDAVVAQLSARGLTLCAVAGVGLAGPPPPAVARATALCTPGYTVPTTVLALTPGVTRMTPKLVLAALLVAGLGAGLLLADARPEAPDKPPAAKGPAAKVLAAADGDRGEVVVVFRGNRYALAGRHADAVREAGLKLIRSACEEAPAVRAHPEFRIVDDAYARPLRQSCVIVTPAKPVELLKHDNETRQKYTLRVESVMIPFSPDLDPDAVYVSAGLTDGKGGVKLARVYRDFMYEYCDDIRDALVDANVYPSDKPLRREEPPKEKAADKPVAKDDLAKLQGGWELVSLEINGRKVMFGNPEDRAAYDLVVTSDRWQTRRLPDRDATFVIDPTKPIKTLDRTFRHGDRPENAAQTYLGIYKLDGDTLTMCHWASATERPDKFESRKGLGAVYVWTRKKP